MSFDEKIVCPDCGAEIELNDHAMVGDIIECGECGTEVEIISLNPLKYAELKEELINKGEKECNTFLAYLMRHLEISSEEVEILRSKYLV